MDTDKPVEMTRARILLVDDDPSNLDVLSRLLRPHYDVLPAPSGERALQIAAGAQKPDLILLDVLMPGMDGYAVLARLHDNPATRDIPVIFVTGLDSIEDEEKGLELGAVDYITKPYRPLIILARVHAQLELKRARDFLADYNRILEEQVEARTAELRESEERFRNATETARDAFIVLEGEGGTIREWNPAAEALFGYSKEEAIGRTIHEFLPPPRFREAAQRGIEHFAATGEGAAIGKTLELIALHKSGEEFPIELSISAMRLGDKWHATGIARDVTERKRAALALRERMKELTCLYAVSRDVQEVLSIDELCRRCVDHLIPAMQFPEISVPVIELNGERIATGNYTQGLSHCLHAEIIMAGKSLGHLRVYYVEDRPFLIPYEQDLVTEVAGAIGMWLQRKQAEQAIKSSEGRYHQLFENMSSGVAIYQPDAACEVFTFKTINQAAERIERLRREKVVGRSVEDVFPGVRAFGLLAVLQRVCRSGEAERFSAAFYQDERIAGWRENHVYRLNSGEVVAVYDDVTERKEHEARIARLNIALRILSAGNSALIHAQTEAELFLNVCRNIVEIGAYQLAWVAYPGEGPDSALVSFVHFGDEAIHRLHAELALMPEHASHCLSAAALRTRQTQLCDNLHKRTECDFDPLREAGVEAILALPLLHDDDVHGVLTIFSSTPDVFGADEVKLMEELAADLAYGIVTLRTRTQRDQAVEGELNQSVMLRQALEQTIVAIALTLEKRDPYTTGHQQRVAEISAAIATEMGLSPQKVEGIHFGSLIHDIGKVYVPAEILNRPGRLTELEFGLIKTHPQVGFEIVKDIPFPWPVAQMVLQHHERLDGSGYPQGLKGEEIMLEARILAVADVLEAMAAHRPYRAALGMEAAIKELERGRGTAFDSAVVDACLRLVQEKGFTFTSQ